MLHDFRAGGKKLLAKGHVISEEDARMLETEGMNEVWVTELEEGEVGEDDAVMQVASEIGCGSLEIRLAAGGRANLFTTEACCILVDDELLKQINCTASMAIATSLNFSYARSGQRVATVKSTPFAVAKPQLEAMISIVKERGPILQARPIRAPAVAVLYTDPVQRRTGQAVVREYHAAASGSDRNQLQFCPLVYRRGRRGGAFAATPAARETHRVLIASTTAPAGPEDVIGRAMVRAGCHIERFLAPVEPGNLFLLGYKDDVPMVSAPGCFRSAKPNVVDLMLPPMLARYRVSGWEIACLGHGGLLT